jgi:glutathione S-transferase
VDERLSKVPWLAGEEFTAADIMSVFSLTTMRAFAPTDLSPYPNILAYLKRVGERPGYQKAMKKGDPDMMPALGAESPPDFLEGIGIGRK